jgi:hypothetical protein
MVVVEAGYLLAIQGDGVVGTVEPALEALDAFLRVQERALGPPGAGLVELRGGSTRDHAALGEFPPTL